MALELADIFQAHGGEYLESLGERTSGMKRRIIQVIANCRTAALGGHRIVRCSNDDCDFVEHSYNSCRNRHCPKCQSSKTAEWVEARSEELLPIQYFHVVFTLPHIFNELVLQNKVVAFNILFRAVKETLLEVAQNPKHLGARIGFFAILHTWTKLLLFHAHLHCVIPAGGIDFETNTWKHAKGYGKRKRFFAPVKILSAVFQGKFVDYLKQAHRKNQLNLSRTLEHLQDASAFEQFLDSAVQQSWVVYCQPPFAGPAAIVKYLARYTLSVAIANSRLVAFDNDTVTFRYRNSADHDKQKLCTLPAQSFIKRFLLHILPRGFTRIRYYGFLAAPNKKRLLTRCREFFEQTTPSVPEKKKALLPRCPKCKVGFLVVEISREIARLLQVTTPQILDSS